MNYIFLNFLIIIILVLILLISSKFQESFAYNAPYFRSQNYQNVCEPDYGGLLKVKRSLQDDCLRTLDGPLYPKIQCYYDAFMNKRCIYE